VNYSFKLRTDASTYLKLKHAIRHENFGVLTIKHDLKCLTAFMKWLVFNKKIHTYSLKHGLLSIVMIKCYSSVSMHASYRSFHW